MTEPEKKELTMRKRLLLKLTSLKNLLAIFCAVLLGFIVFTKSYDFKELAYALVLLLGLFCGVNVAEKKILK